MALTPENGDIVAGADTYVTLEAYQAYGAAVGWTLGGDAADEINLRRAFQALNRNWVYLGELVDADQVGAFPRTTTNGIPKAIEEAQCELAYLIQGGLDPFATVSDTAGETLKVGPITITEQASFGSQDTLRAVEGLLRPFLAAGAGQVQMVRG